MKFKKINKLKKGDKVAIISPSFAAPGKWPHVYELGLRRIREVFELEPVEFKFTKKIGATGKERTTDLIKAFSDKNIKAVIASLGGNDQVTYIKNLPPKIFSNNPKMFFGFSDNTHFENFLWLNGVPSYYGASLFTQFCMQKRMDDFTVKFLKHAFFETGEFELTSSEEYNDVALSWDDPANLEKERFYEPNEGLFFDGKKNAKGISWGGCLESIDEILRHGGKIPTLKDFENIILFTETSEEIPSADNVFRVYRALGERGILGRVKGLLVGRPQAWNFDDKKTAEQKTAYRAEQRETILKVFRTYNKTAPVVQNMDIGHTNPQICLPNGRLIRVDAKNKKVFAEF